MKFTKMHGAGNDYIYVDGFSDPLPEQPELLARKLSDRHKGIGADGLILICPTEQADAEMRMFNADGSQAEMCGNGIRCVAKYLVDRNLTPPTLTVLTGAGIKEIQVVRSAGGVDFVKVDMGAPQTVAEAIPTTLNSAKVPVVNASLSVEGIQVVVTCVSMGNPHCVVFLDANAELKGMPEDKLVSEFGPLIENHDAFPKRTNVEFVELLQHNRVRQRTWERGSGETMACGTGACAVLVAGVLTTRTGRRIACHLNGGTLDLEWDETTNHVLMTGPAEEVFHGQVLVG